MGIFTSMLGLPDVNKHVAAKNALVAKYTYQNLNDSMKKNVNDKIIQILIEGGYHPDRVLERFKGLKETEYFLLAAVAFNNLGLEPQLKDICLFNIWHPVKNPFFALIDAEKEIKLVCDEIMKKHNISITIND